MKSRLAYAASLMVLMAVPGAAPAQALAPFSRDELITIVDMLVKSQGLTPSTRIARVAVDPAAKTHNATPRRARITLVGDEGTREALLDVATQDVLAWRQITDGRSPVLSEEWSRATAALKSDPAWQAAMARRGYTTFENIFCESLSAGYFPDQPGAEKRVLRMPCYDIAGATTNVYGRPIEGLVATVDARTGEVLALLDEGVTPLPAPPLQPPLVGASAPTPAPTPTRARDFSLDGTHVSFGAWDLHVRLDDQFGMILADAGFTHRGGRRSVLTEGHVSEIFVPYMDPSDAWAFRTYLDAGEFGLGTLTSPLIHDIDCPHNAAYLNALTLSALGKIIEKQRAICVFTRPLAGPLWRHYEALNGMHSGQAGRELVVRSIASIAHYDYVMDWIFRPQGDIEVRIGATGIDAVKAIDPNAPPDPYGRRVTPDLSAIYHDHFFSLRLDLDVDGPDNRLVREHVRRTENRSNALGRSLWMLEAETVPEEGSLEPDAPGVWRIEASSRTNAVGHPTAYQLVTEGTVSLLAADDTPQKRGAFSAAPLWVTRHAALERAAAGAYPNQSKGGAGLPGYVDGQSILDADLVLWPTLGFRHITRSEDWPILSTVWKSVLLRPYGFFDANPTVPTAE